MARAAGTMAAAVAVLLTASCSGSSQTPGDATGSATAGESATGAQPTQPGPLGTNAVPPQDPVDALAQFEVPEESSGFGAADPTQCPAVNPAVLLAAFPDATPLQGTSREVEDADATDDEFTVQCRLSYDVAFDDNECTFLELRDMTFSPDAQSVVDDQPGQLSTTSGRTYFVGAAQSEGVVFRYSIEAGCDGDSDLSDYENQFRAAWEGNRDGFIAAGPLARP